MGEGLKESDAATADWPLTGREERETEITAAFYRVAEEHGWESAIEGVAWALAKAEEDRDANA